MRSSPGTSSQHTAQQPATQASRSATTVTRGSCAAAGSWSDQRMVVQRSREGAILGMTTWFLPSSSSRSAPDAVQALGRFVLFRVFLLHATVDPLARCAQPLFHVALLVATNATD